MSAAKTSTSEAVASLISIPILIGLGLAWRAHVLSVLWAWFVVGRFHLAEMDRAAAAGLLAVAWVLTYTYRPAPKNDDKPLLALAKSYGITFFIPAYFLFLGWIARNWV
jgi:hypothetical protein